MKDSFLIPGYRRLVRLFLLASVATAIFLLWLVVRDLFAGRFDPAAIVRTLSAPLALMTVLSALLWRQIKKVDPYNSVLKRFFAVVFTVCAALVALGTFPWITTAIIARDYRFDLKSLGFAKKNLWDWLDLLVVPLAVLFGGYLLNRAQRIRELEIENQRAQGEALRAYLDKMGEWLLDHDLRTTSEDAEVRTLARVRTLATLEELSTGRFSAQRRKRRLVQFLSRTGLIEKNSRIIRLNGANLTGALLTNAILSNHDLSKTVLSYADLAYSKLDKANLHGTDLAHSVLHGADLTGANLTDANLTDADLTRADLTRADLTRAVTKGKLEKQVWSLKEATMPDGSLHN